MTTLSTSNGSRTRIVAARDQRLQPTRSRWSDSAALFAIVGVVVSLLVVAVPATSAHAVPPVSTAPIDLGRAAPFAIVAGASIGNTATGPVTVVRGDLGVLAAAGAVTGFPPGEVRGTLFASGAQPVVDAHADLVSAFADAAARSSNFALAGDLIGLTLHPGVHTNVGAVANTGTVTLNGDGDPNAVFIFQVGGALAMAAGSNVTLTNGTQAKNVFWQVTGAGAVGANSNFAGTLMTSAAIGIGANSSFNGRALAKTGAVTTNSNQFYSAPPAIAINGGAAVSAPDDTPTISGTVTIDLPATVAVTIGLQVLSAAVQTGGSWTVTASPTANGTYSVDAAAIDGAGNIGLAHQSLTIDTVPPVVTLTGGSTRLTNDSTPTIDGTSDGASGTLVTVTVAGQTLTAVVQVSGQWNVNPAALIDGTGPVVAAVVDEAGNPGTATQSLTVDTIQPLVAMVGGATRLTNDPTPAISGTATDLGAAVTVTVSGIATTATVQNDLTWSITAAVLADGLHPVVVSVTDAAGNIGTTTQSLTVDTVAPGISINGGSAATTSDTTPTIIGVSGAASGSIVTLTVAGQTWTTLVQSNGSWNITPTVLATSTHTVAALVADPAGNVSMVTQTLTITTSTVPVVTDPPGTTPPPAGTSAPAISPVGPKRVFDTRIGQSADLLRNVAKAKVGGAYELEVQLTDLAAYVPATGVGAVSLNVTVANSEGTGFVTVYACGNRESVSSVNFTVGQAVANAVMSPVSSTGTVCFYASAFTDIIVDINGWLPAGQAFSAIGPKRLFDTRLGASDLVLRTVAAKPLAAGELIEVPVTGLTGYVPSSGVDSVSLNVTVTNPIAYGYITVYACGTREEVSSVNYSAGQTVANAVVAPVSAAGTVCFYAHSATDVIVDINGWFKTSAGFVGVSPQRVLDTRAGTPATLRTVAKSKIGGSYVLEVRVTDLTNAVPASGVAVVSLNVTATNADGNGFVTVFACGVREEVSSLNYSAGQTVANAVLAPVSAAGSICLFSLAPTDVIVDINGWFAAT